MNPTSLAAGLSILLTLGACAPTSRITLLPEEDGRTSAVSVKTRSGTELLARPYQTASMDSTGNILTGETSAEAVRERHKLIFSVQATERFTLYFESGGAVLTPQSKAHMALVLLSATQRSGGEITITGYADSVGKPEVNVALSLERAKTLRDLLLKNGFKAELIKTAGQGQRELAVPTAEGVDEPRNRRAEIVLH